MTRRWWVPYAFLAPALVGLLVFRFAPIGIAVVGSLFAANIRGDTFFVGLKNFAELFEDPSFWSVIKVTLWFNLIINPFQICCALGLAMLVRRPTQLHRHFSCVILAADDGIDRADIDHLEHHARSDARACEWIASVARNAGAAVLPLR